MRHKYWTPVRHALADIRTGGPGAVCTGKIRLFLLSKDDAEKTELAEWMQAYNAELDRSGYEYATRLVGRTPKIVTRLVPKAEVQAMREAWFIQNNSLTN